MKRIALLLAGIVCSTMASAGFGGMGGVDDSGGGDFSLGTILLTFAIFAALFYGAIKYADRFEGNLGFGRIAIGIVVILVLVGIFGT